MNRYIKLEDAEKLLTNALRIAQGFDEPLERSLVDLPTIEVSDEQLSKLQSSENSVENTTASEDFTSISRANSKLEVSEDAISREDAVNALIAHFIPQTYTGEQVEQASKLAWKIMANAPSVVPQVPNEDCISRHYMLRALNGYGKDWQEDCEIADVIRNAPSVIPTAKEGEWKFKKIFPNDDSEFPMGYLVCSVCGSQHANATPCNYCDNCGAKMKGADDETN